MKLKISAIGGKNNSRQAILIVVFVLVMIGVFGLGKVEKASAATATGTCYKKDNPDPQYSMGGDITVNGSMTQTDCTSKGSDYYWKSAADVAKAGTDKIAANNAAINKDSVCPGVDITTPSLWINCALVHVLRFFGWILIAAATLFANVADTAVIDAVLKNAVIYQMWAFVRDILNIAFILVLLFSAFCTVFQISKYSYKNILLTLIIMALLVNFSFPIARVIIDFSNVLMYYFIQKLNITSGAEIFASFAKDSAIGTIIYDPSNVNADMTYLIAAIVFVFIFSATLLMISILLLIRVVVLAVLIIFSSIAFVGAIVPFLSTQASKWWDNLFRYSFFGPIMVFMIYVASEMLSKTNTLQSKFGTVANAQSSGNGSIIGAMAFFMIPIVILWVGIGFAQSMSIAGAQIARKAGFGAMKWASTAPAKAGWWGIKKTGTPGAVKQRWDQYKKDGWLGSEKTAQREARKAASLGVKGALEKDMRRRAEEHKKNFTTEAELKTLAASGDAGAAYRLAEDKQMDQATYDNFLNRNADESLRKAVNVKVKQNRNDLVAINRSHDPTELAAPATIANAAAAGVTPVQYLADQQMGNLSSEQWNDQNWTAILQPLPAGATPAQIADRNNIIRATQTAWINLSPQAANEVRKRLTPNNSAALNAIGIV